MVRLKLGTGLCRQFSHEREVLIKSVLISSFSMRSNHAMMTRLCHISRKSAGVMSAVFSFSRVFPFSLYLSHLGCLHPWVKAGSKVTLPIPTPTAFHMSNIPLLPHFPLKVWTFCCCCRTVCVCVSGRWCDLCRPNRQPSAQSCSSSEAFNSFLRLHFTSTCRVFRQNHLNEKLCDTPKLYLDKISGSSSWVKSHSVLYNPSSGFGPDAVKILWM